jgi:hypothetical protein
LEETNYARAAAARSSNVATELQRNGIGVGEAKTRQAGRQAVPLQGCGAPCDPSRRDLSRNALSAAI